MTIEQIKGAICEFFNSRGEFANCPFIQAPSNRPAPKGNYIAVGCDSVRQDGSMMQPVGPGNGKDQWLNVGQFYLTEVEGDGDKLRRARNLMQKSVFRVKAEEKGFTVWNVGDIMRLDTYDGEFYVRQWRLTVTLNFADVDDTVLEKIASVSPITFNN